MNELEILQRKLNRERLARKQAEQILETKALELFQANDSLKKLNESLEDQISQRTKDLQESESKYRNVIDQAADIIYSTDENGYFTFINPRGSDAFGYTVEEIIGTRFIDFVIDEHKTGLYEYYTKIKKGGVANDYYEFPIRSKDGQIHWIGQNVNRVEVPNGDFYFNAVARDITLRKNTEKELDHTRQALQQSEVKYRSVLENMDLGLMEVDNKGIIVRVYEKFCQMTGYSPKELIGKDAIETLIVKDYEDVLRTQDKNRLERKSSVYEARIRRKDGKEIWVLISGAPFYNTEGEVSGSLGIHYDISDRKNLEANLEIAKEKAVKAQRAEQQFLANMSHEIRTPLNAIIGMSHLLKDSELDDKQIEFIEILSNSANLLKGLVSDILDISKIDSGMAEMNETAFDLSELAYRLIKTFGIRAEERSISIVSNIDCKGKSIVESDKQWLNQILINLLGNAIKFTKEGQIELTIKHISDTKSYSTYYFEVSDTGIGMNPEELKKVFTAFKQANTQVQREFGGTGLGLSISSRLVSLLGGQLEAESVMNEGSRFFFSLQLKSSSATHSMPKRISDFSTRIAEGIKLLVVEDNQMNQKYILSLLNKWDIDYDIVDDGLQAVEIYKTSTYDLIFMDLSMPVMDGYEATGIIRKLPGKQIPIIALTASTFLSKKELALQSGMTDFLAKPFTPDDLSLMIEKHIGTSVAIAKETGDTFAYDVTLDTKYLDEIYGNDYVYALDMFSIYQDMIIDEVNQLHTFAEGDAYADVKKQAHKVKPVFSMVGLTHLTVLSEQIESLVQEKKTKDVKRMCEELKNKVTLSMPTIEAEIQRLRNMTN